MGKLTINGPCSIAMLKNQRVHRLYLSRSNILNGWMLNLPFLKVTSYNGNLKPKKRRCSSYSSLNIWVNYNDLTTTSLGIMVSKGNHPQMGLIQVCELL